MAYSEAFLLSNTKIMIKLQNIKYYAFPKGYSYELFTGVVDNRKVFKGPTEVVVKNKKQPPLEGEAYIFPVKGRELMKILFKDADGMGIATLSDTPKAIRANPHLAEHQPNAWG